MPIRQFSGTKNSSDADVIRAHFRNNFDSYVICLRRVIGDDCFSMPTDTSGPIRTPAAYRQFAAECIQAARLTTSADVRATLEEMARRWTELAARAERNARQLRGKPT